jgi:hypothetical protein
LRSWLIEQGTAAGQRDLPRPGQGCRHLPGVRWKDALTRAHEQCEVVICLLFPEWDASEECRVEYRVADTLHKKIFCPRQSPSTGAVTQEWQWVDLFGDGPKTPVDVPDHEAVYFLSFVLDEHDRLSEWEPS